MTSWRCQTPGIAVKHALAHVAICGVTRQHLGVPQTTEGEQRRAVDPEAGTRAIDRPRSLLAGVCGTPRCPPCLSRIANRMARVSTVMPAVWLPRRRPRGLRHARHDTRLINTHANYHDAITRAGHAPASVIRCARHAGRARLLFWPSGTAHQAVAPHNAYVSTVPRPGRTTRCRPLAHGDRRTLVQAPDSA